VVAQLSLMKGAVFAFMRGIKNAIQSRSPGSGFFMGAGMPAPAILPAGFL